MEGCSDPACKVESPCTTQRKGEVVAGYGPAPGDGRPHRLPLTGCRGSAAAAGEDAPSHPTSFVGGRGDLGAGGQGPSSSA